MRVRIYHSVDRDFMFRAWRPAAALKLVDDYHILGDRVGSIFPKRDYPAPSSGAAITSADYGNDEVLSLTTGQVPEKVLELIYRDPERGRWFGAQRQDAQPLALGG